MECESQESISPGCALLRAVIEARRRLNAIEEKHERVVKDWSPEIHSVGLQYSHAVHEYVDAVMAWLAWLHTREKAG